MQVGRMISSNTSERTDSATLVGEVTAFVGEKNSKLDPIQFLLLQSSLLLQQTKTIAAGQIHKCVFESTLFLAKNHPTTTVLLPAS